MYIFQFTILSPWNLIFVFCLQREKSSTKLEQSVCQGNKVVMSWLTEFLFILLPISCLIALKSFSSPASDLWYGNSHLVGYLLDFIGEWGWLVANILAWEFFFFYFHLKSKHSRTSVFSKVMQTKSAFRQVFSSVPYSLQLVMRNSVNSYIWRRPFFLLSFWRTLMVQPYASHLYVCSFRHSFLNIWVPLYQAVSQVMWGIQSFNSTC